VETATIFNDYFASVFTQEGTGPVPDFQDRVGEDSWTQTLKITEVEVQARLLALDTGKSPGPDNVYPRLLKKMCEHTSWAIDYTI